MKTLYIYDLEGNIVSTQTGNFKEPKGLPFVIEDAPTNKYPSHVDVSGEKHFVVYKSLEPNELEIIKNLLLHCQEMILQQEDAIIELSLLSNGGE